MNKETSKLASTDILGEIEWIRAISCILVIIIHVTAEFWTSFMIGSIQYKSIILLNTISQFAVPCFICISGFVLYYVYHNKEYNVLKFYKKRITKIVIPYLVWSAIYIIVIHNYYKPPISLAIIVEDILQGRASGHLYFIILILQFYILFPLILKVYKIINNKILSMGVFLGINIITVLFIRTPFKDRFFMNYLMFFGLGFLLADLKLKGFKSKYFLKATIFTVYLIFTVYYFIDRYSTIVGLPFIFKELHRYVWWIFSLISILNIYLIANMFKDRRLSLIENKIIKSLSNHSFTIYLSHMFFIILLRQSSSFNKLKNYSMTLAFIFELIGIICISWLASIIFEGLKNMISLHIKMEY